MLAIGLINQAADPVTIVVVVCVVVIVLLVLVMAIVGGVGDDVLAHSEEVIVTVKPPLDPFGGVSFVGIEWCDKFFMEG